ncbi:hypothetical protein PR202_ga13014 [Eleusine coracana subsp. coracana]|uniref:Uncharacterized protein n=1 Tax=Eleusine coracana subsp. coracana TaxID=191504 RepID=A0AAV5CD51_ELECO|nr:hypothetical protein PR202_ga13014 [Eleusine coracana subsp. coracana]
MDPMLLDRAAAMAGKEEDESRILVGGLSWLTDERMLEESSWESFRRFGTPSPPDAVIRTSRRRDAQDTTEALVS